MNGYITRNALNVIIYASLNIPRIMIVKETPGNFLCNKDVSMRTRLNGMRLWFDYTSYLWRHLSGTKYASKLGHRVGLVFILLVSKMAKEQHLKKMMFILTNFVVQGYVLFNTEHLFLDSGWGIKYALYARHYDYVTPKSCSLISPVIRLFV